MRSRVVQLYAAGVRRARMECRTDPGVVGDLRVDQRDAVGSRSGRAQACASLQARQSPHIVQNILPPLFDVVLLRVTPVGMLLRGIQYHSTDGRVVTEYPQEWWC